MYKQITFLACFFIAGCAHNNCKPYEYDDSYIYSAGKTEMTIALAATLVSAIYCSIEDSKPEVSNAEVQRTVAPSEVAEKCMTWRYGENVSCEEGAAIDEAKLKEAQEKAAKK